MAYEYKNSKGTQYFLHSQEITLKGSGKKQRIFYFSRTTNQNALNDLPSGYKVVESQKTGLPVLKKA